MEKKIEPMEPTLKTINLGNDEYPHLIKIGSTYEVFAWSYKDMPGIDPEIAQHHIDTHDHMVPIKQKLKRMRIEWLLKIKESSLSN